MKWSLTKNAAVHQNLARICSFASFVASLFETEFKKLQLTSSPAWKQLLQDPKPVPKIV